jgi:NAD(P)H-flavin reductase
VSPGVSPDVPAGPAAGWSVEPAEPGRVARFLPRTELPALIGALQAEGRTVAGPTIVDGAIRIAEIESPAELPIGWTATTSPGSARLEHHADGPAAERIFDTAVSWSGIKPWTYPARVAALGLEHEADGSIRVLAETDPEAPARPIAIIGARACDLAALAIHDRVLAGGPAVDPDYAARRAGLFIVAVECAVATSTCFCPSMGSGPEVTSGADVVLSEIDGGFAARGETPAGVRLLDRLGLAPATQAHVAAAAAQVAATRASMDGRGVELAGLHDRLLANLDHPRWDEVAQRCLACGNCTLVCPTCFCSGLEVGSDLDGRTSSATRTWDSCFTAGFAQVAGGSFRPRHRDRYRQWLTHKFATWWDQFGTAGCVGCGRCIAWCPVGIDVRDELAVIAAPGAPAAHPRLAPSPARSHAPKVLPAAYLPATVAGVHAETADTTTLRLVTDDRGLLRARPGQFVMAAMPAFAIPPLSISRINPDGLELTIRAAGPATSFLTRLQPGAELALRGPLGRPWPVHDAVGRDVVIVGGGIGLAPLRGLVDALLAERDRFGAIRLYIGARTPQDRLFMDEIDALAARDDLLVRVTVDRAGPEWLGRVGIVTQLFRSVRGTGENVTAFICGPERMMTATVDSLVDLGVPPKHTWLTLERHMECGVGLCGHCQMGTRFVCRDGPVFSVAELGDDLRREGL